ncbi:MAG: hypothetical protein CMB99_07480 [Flavobacteriaceae bacterium]|nr:hypothetical protein [Flavobacteriaceae bacterium]|tara:strand:+ start:101874 stop:102869 length:996 start_codon:yes stop_codon:yes gene_type:complete
MIKFFRKIRQKLLSKNRFNKYLLYAFGEIILVVIGILIALQINNWNESKKNHEKVDKLLVKIQKDIKTDITEIKDLVSFYNKKDSIIKLVLNNQIPRKEYEVQSDHLHLLIFDMEFVRPKKESYSNLIRNQDIIPPEYDFLLEDLTILYNDLYSYIQNREEVFEKRTSKFRDYLFENHDWFSMQKPRHKNSERIDFLMTNVRYKGMVEAYRTDGIHNYMRISQAYADKAMTVYEKINKVLNSGPLKSDFSIQLKSDFYGNYKTIANQNFPLLKIGTKTFTKNKDTIKLFPYSKNKFFLNNYFFRIQRENDTTFLYTTGYLYGKKPFAYKID